MELSEIIKNLNADDIAKLRETAKNVFGGETPEAEKVKSEPVISESIFADPKMIEKIMKFSSLMTENDEKTEFLLALKPLLNEKRRQKADTAIQLQRLLRIFRAMSGDDPSGSGAPLGQ